MPSRARRSPPMPKVCSVGSSFLSSRTTSDACRSPDASPATMANFTPAPRPVAELLGCSVARRSVAEQPSNRATQQPSFEREGIHQPRQRDAAEEQAAEHKQKESNALAPRMFPQQREIDAGHDRVDEHQDHVIA